MPSPYSKDHAHIGISGPPLGIATLLRGAGSGPLAPGLASEWGQFLDGFDSSHYLTLTSRSQRTPEQLMTDFKKYIRSLERVAQNAVYWFVAGEEAIGGWGHLHALTAGTGSLRTKTLERQWRSGFSRARRFDPARGAAYYVVKEVGSKSKMLDWYDLSKRLSKKNRLSDNASG